MEGGLRRRGGNQSPLSQVFGTLRRRACLRDSGSAAAQGAGARGLLETKANTHFTEAATAARGEGVPGPLEISPEPKQTQRLRFFTQAPKP